MQSIEDAPPSNNTHMAAFLHDLRNPLFALLANLEMLQKRMGSASGDQLKEYLHAARQSGQRVDQMVSDMLQLAREQHQPKPTLHFEEILVDKLFNRLWNTFHLQAKRKDIHLRMILRGEAALCVCADVALLERSLENLLQNAIKFTDPNGEVVLSGSATTGWILLEVSDTGRGIAPENLKRLFKPYFQTREQDATLGFGLGLHNVKQNVEAHRGRLTVESKVGRGSRFSIWLPAAQ